MADSKLRLTRRSNEIKAVLKEVVPYSELVLWINSDEKRILFQGNLIRLDPQQDLVYFHVKNPPPELQHQIHVYAKFSAKSGVGKCLIYSFKDTTLVLQVSDELIVDEHRKYRRIQFRHDDEKKITLKTSEREIEFEVVNVSRSGIRMKARPADLIAVRAANPLILARLGETKVKIGARLVWNDESTLAIELERILSAEEFDAFAKTLRGPDPEPEKFYHDQEYFETVRSNMQEIITKLEKRPKLATAMKTLKLDRDGNYLKNHIDLLCYVSCSLGRMLGWVTQKTIDKLIMAAYLHDIRYFERPHLAKIKSLAEFNEIKATLSESDQKMFLEGPDYSRVMSQDESANSVDVERILIQQKERPDGSGFPAGVDFKQLYPLSCLFMVCHEFVDYVYSTPSWSFKDFTTKARLVYKGPYFIKILEAFDEIS
jgi:HD-GYP domain-containing protein (c-di-GMP phosphodiesterase class II)